MFKIKNKILMSLLLLVIVSAINTGFAQEYSIPSWIKNNAGLWANNSIDDATFVNGIQFLISEEIIKIPKTEVMTKSDQIPQWVKNNAMLWSEEMIDDATFVNALDYLIKNGVIQITNQEAIEDRISNISGFNLTYASIVKGSMNAPVTIIEFGDYQCPNCRAWLMNQEPIISQDYIDTGIVKMYFIDFAFIGEDSIFASLASHCAGEQDKFWEYHDILYDRQGRINSGWANTDALKIFAQELELDAKTFDECLDSKKYINAIESNFMLGLEKGVDHTPTFFIIGSNEKIKQIDGPQPAIVFSNVINEIYSE